MIFLSAKTQEEAHTKQNETLRLYTGILRVLLLVHEKMLEKIVEAEAARDITFEPVIINYELQADKKAAWLNAPNSQYLSKYSHVWEGYRAFQERGWQRSSGQDRGWKDVLMTTM